MGREFIELFNEWSESYDATVSGHDIEYKAVFENYDEILKAVSTRVNGHIIEFGVGTGNLTNALLKNGNEVTGVEPSPAMREIAIEKVTNASIHDGDFLHFPTSEKKINGFVSSYAFHHLTDEEKKEAIKLYRELLPKDGKIVFADTIFLNNDAKSAMIKKAEDQHFLNLATDLKTEYYTTIPVLKEMLEEYGFAVTFTQMNDFVWIIDATKQ
ncbi:putative AdoMet-dependent methyltransferase [Salirhabdus euzebyi]|uniref:Uncharacterized methyltransferase HNQ94_000772 n=1 Tax=Salirhabdus euzebyi TaxID=394506 RepID=A0A841PTL4_9BACI|nr:class I SAM-dependent methyltransferase [Salirhabdus euzebyi]MBB6452327.1 putative AdoMet-dependent methyltransferase [Salirhabdus euzebyi]